MDFAVIPEGYEARHRTSKGQRTDGSIRRGETMEELTSEQKAEKIMERIMERWRIDRASARALLHKFVCQGKCNWFEARKPPERFELDLTEQQREEIEEIVSRIMKGVSKDKARREIHTVLCHPI